MRATAFRICWAVALAVSSSVAPVRADPIDASQLVSMVEAGFRTAHPLAWGQTFTPPAGAGSLDRFDLWMGLNTNSGFPETVLPFNVRVFVQRWQESAPNFGAPFGELLSVSSPQLVADPATRNPSTLKRLSFTLDAPVTPGAQYVAFVSAFGFTDEATRAGLALGRLGLSFSRNGFTVGHDYPGGHLVTGEIIGSDATDSNWCRGPGCNLEKLDLAFIANFAPSQSPVPEPSGLLLLITGVAATMWRSARHGHGLHR